MSNTKSITLSLMLFLNFATLVARTGFAYDLGIPYVTAEGGVGVGLGLGSGVDITGDQAGHIRVGSYSLGPWQYSGFDPEEFKKFVRNKKGSAPVARESLQGRALVTRVALSPGKYCKEGGVVVRAGMDRNFNGVLDDIEIDHQSVICGQEAEAVHVSFAKIPALYSRKCILGGEEVKVWSDLNYNGKMEDAEVRGTPAWCNTLSGLLNPARSQVGTGPTPVNPAAVSGRHKASHIDAGAQGEQDAGRADAGTVDAGAAH